MLVTGATGGNPDKKTVSLESDLWSNLTEEISLSEAQVKMSKKGTLNYGDLSSGEKLFLFNEFKSKHSKKVPLNEEKVEIDHNDFCCLFFKPKFRYEPFLTVC